MKPAPFKYYAPTTMDEALARLAEHGSGLRIESELSDREGKVRALLVLVPDTHKDRGP